ncbi:MAG: hypothetical protein JXM71_04760 [Spirochaetales bacterium]|nr:hypothetical protein [Spirochaetales bacterium]
MKIVDLSNILRKQTHIYYRREFKADATIEIMDRTRTIPIEFVLEHKPTGGVEINTTLGESVEYPLVPLLSMLKTYIGDLDKRGALP